MKTDDIDADSNCPANSELTQATSISRLPVEFPVALNRHKIFGGLLAAWNTTGNAAYPALFDNLTADWIAQNRPPSDISGSGPPGPWETIQVGITPGVYVRHWTKATVSVDCTTLTGEIQPIFKTDDLTVAPAPAPLALTMYDPPMPALPNGSLDTDALAGLLASANANAVSFMLWSTSGDEYLRVVEFLEGTKHRDGPAVWITLMPPTGTEVGQNTTGCRNASALCPASHAFPYGNSDAGYYCCLTKVNKFHRP
jgi:hypothetical protein